MEIHLLYDKFVEVTREGDENDPYDIDDTYTEWKILGLSLTPPEKNSLSLYYTSTEVGFTPTKNKLYYVVYVIYSFGDSFSWEECGNLTLIDVYETLQEAEATKKAILDHYHTDDDKRKELIYTLSNGEKITEERPPWVGYFEKLNMVEIIPCTL